MNKWFKTPSTTVLITIYLKYLIRQLSQKSEFYLIQPCKIKPLQSLIGRVKKLSELLALLTRFKYRYNQANKNPVMELICCIISIKFKNLIL